MKLNDYMELHYPIIIETIFDDGEKHMKASIEELSGLVVYGDSYEEVLEEIEGAKEIWFLTNMDLGRSIPLPKNRDSSSHSGKLTLRIAKSTHKDLVKEAELEGLSLNSYINLLLEKGKINHSLEKLIRHSVDDITSELEKMDSTIKNHYENRRSFSQYHFHLNQEPVPYKVFNNFPQYSKMKK